MLFREKLEPLVRLMLMLMRLYPRLFMRLFRVHIWLQMVEKQDLLVR